MKTIYKSLVYILDSSQKRYLLVLLVMLFIGLIFEFLSIGILLPILNIAINDEYSFLLPIINFLNIQDSSNELIFKLVIIFSISIYTIKFLFLLFLNFKNYTFLNSLSASLSNKLFKKYLYNNFIFHINNNSSYLIKNITTEISSLRVLLESSLTLVLETLIFLSIVLLLLFIQPIPAIIVFSFFSVSTLLYHFFSKNKIKAWGILRRDYDNKISKILFETFGGITEIKIFGKENLFFENFKSETNAKAKVISKDNILGQTPKLFLEYITVFSVFGLLIIMITLGADKSEILVTLGIFAAASFKIIPSINKIIYCIQKIKFNYPALSIVYDELINNNLGQIKTNSDSVEFNNISFKNVSFAYSNNNILENVNLNILSGKVIGVIGRTGNGKSTFINLFAGLIKQNAGDIIINNDNSLTNLIDLKILGYVPQSPFLLDATIKDNICFGNRFETEKFIYAIKDAQLTNFINSLESGYETIVGERGVMLSGGQRQRISIARALYNDAQVIIFDEPTSALDSETETNLLKSINKLKGNKTIVIVSHSKSILKFCDEVYKISNKNINKI